MYCDIWSNSWVFAPIFCAPPASAEAGTTITVTRIGSPMTKSAFSYVCSIEIFVLCLFIDKYSINNHKGSIRDAGSWADENFIYWELDRRMTSASRQVWVVAETETSSDASRVTVAHLAPNWIKWYRDFGPYATSPQTLLPPSARGDNMSVTRNHIDIII